MGSFDHLLVVGCVRFVFFRLCRSHFFTVAFPDEQNTLDRNLHITPYVLFSVFSFDSAQSLLVPQTDQFSLSSRSMLFLGADDQSKGLIFAASFIIPWLGAGVVTANSVLLGGKISFFQAICLLGYCVFPLAVAALLVRLWDNWVYKGVLVGVTFAWSTFCTFTNPPFFSHPFRSILSSLASSYVAFVLLFPK
jgi:hypothetical protein